MHKKKTTPMMEQWGECKKQSKDALLLFRLGDFFEAFYEDATVIAKELGLTLTKRQQIPMCGVPCHTADQYIDRLVAKGHKVAIADQVEDPKKATGLVKRELVKILSPGTVTHSSLLQDKKNNFFVSCAQVGAIFGLCICDVTTAEFHILEVEDKKALIDELYRLQPKEILIAKKFAKDHTDILKDLSFHCSFLQNTIDNRYFDHTESIEALRSHFQVHSLDSFGLKGMIAAINASGALITYLKDDLHLSLNHIKVIQKKHLQEYMLLDPLCIKNLEIFSPNTQSSLVDLIDYTKTPMGGRLLRQWMCHPLLHPDNINTRLDSIEEMLLNPEKMSLISSHLEKMGDLERIIMKITTSIPSPRDLVALKISIEHLPELKTDLQQFTSFLMQQDKDNIHDLSPIFHLIAQALVDNPPLRISDGNVFRSGYNKDLDDLLEIRDNSRTWLNNYQASLREKTGIKTLKVGFTKVFGYYIEISKGQAKKAPGEFHRRQTLVNAERFITDELKLFEEKVFTAEEKIKALESSLFYALKEQIALYFDPIMQTAKAIGRIDVLYGLAYCAQVRNFCRPIVDDKDQLIIHEGRHPIIEANIAQNTFIPNDVHLDNQDNQLFLITGPNMAGKSTYIRQIAVITIMAQIGSFVPATHAHIGVIDQVFSRIGASDDLSKGQSTFMVEMTETANILHNATSKSLVILDEIGRGTSTYDGISIAWAVAEFLLTTAGKQAKTLFATHYWELTELEQKIQGAQNYTVAVEETKEGIVFLHKIIKGGTDKSYGIHVARLAGLPYKAIKTAEEMLQKLESQNNTVRKKKKKYLQQQFLFEDLPLKEKEIVDEMKTINLNEVSPMKALEKLVEMQKKISNV